MKLISSLLTLLVAGTTLAGDPPRPKDERDQVTRYHAYHVLVTSQDAAKKARSRILSASQGRNDKTLEALGSVARELSADGDSASLGGDLGRMLEGTLDERFEHAVLALEPGTLSAPFASDFGWHVVYLAEKRAIPVSLLCGPVQPLELGDVARITADLGPAWHGPAADLKGTVTFLRAEKSARGVAYREVTLHRELPHAVLVPARHSPACYRSMRTRLVADCGRGRLAGLSEEYFDSRGGKGTMVDVIEEKNTLDEADFDAVPASGGTRQVYDSVCQAEIDAW